EHRRTCCTVREDALDQAKASGESEHHEHEAGAYDGDDLLDPVFTTARGLDVLCDARSARRAAPPWLSHQGGAAFWTSDTLPDRHGPDCIRCRRSGKPRRPTKSGHAQEALASRRSLPSCPPPCSVRRTTTWPRASACSLMARRPRRRYSASMASTSQMFWKEKIHARSSLSIPSSASRNSCWRRASRAPASLR